MKKIGFKNFFLKVRKDCWRMISRSCVCKDNKYEIFGNLLKPNLKPNSVILDAGCGRGHRTGFLKKDKNRSRLRQYIKYIVGLDLVYGDLKKNPCIDLGLIADLEKIPISTSKIDTVISTFVIEHLRNPENVFKEISRILKKDGKFILMTPNKYGIVTLLSEIIPHRIQPKLNRFITGTDEVDTFPTCFRANTVRVLDNKLKEHCMYRKELIMCQPPPYAFVFSKMICMLAIAYFNLIYKTNCLGFLRGVIAAVYQKYS